MSAAAADLPPWIHSLPVAIWVSDEHMRLSYVNEAAERLFEITGDVVGCHCFEIVRGRDASGAPFCRPDCPAAAAIRDGCANDGFDLKIGDGVGSWTRVFIAPVAGRSSRPIIHFAVPMQREHCAEDFVERVAERTRAASQARLDALTDREKEILALLARDKTARVIADELAISYSTVRNHIQHVLTKMDAHSTLEAVACWVLATAVVSGEE